LAFGTIEAVGYTYVYVAKHELAPSTYGTLFFSLMIRWICLPLLHAVWGGITGFFVGLSYHAPSGSWSWVVRGLIIAAVLHGLYDVGAVDKEYSWLAVTSAAVSLFLFVGYLRTEGTLISAVEKYRSSIGNAE
jgi:RsiW-degrading membrane proteinase PrsW (M82 family)